MITEYFNNVDDKDLVSMLSEGATLQMPIKDDISGTGYIHMRPGAMYHELDPMNVVFEVQRRNTWDQMPSVRIDIFADRLKDFKWNHVLDYLILEDENNCMKYARPDFQKKYAPLVPYDTAPLP